VEFAVNTEDVAFPLESVVSVSVAVPVLAKVPLAVPLGAVKVTATPLVGVEPVVTVATRGAAKAVLTVADWFDPLVAATVGAGGVELELLLQPVSKPRPRKVTKAEVTI
jgi:hypothetical protein